MCCNNPDFDQCCPDCGAPGEVEGHYGCLGSHCEEKEGLFLMLEHENSEDGKEWNPTEEWDDFGEDETETDEENGEVYPEGDDGYHFDIPHP